jgi:hypothetical protein
VDAVAVTLRGTDAADVDHPHPVVVLPHVVVGLGAVLGDEGQFHPGGARRPQSEEGPAVTDMSPEK